MVLAAMTPEFDAFGPWIDRVTSAEQVPRLYAAYPLNFETAKLVLKVPRNITRRDATADMDLYDHLLIAGEAGITILSRYGARFTESLIDYKDVVAISQSLNVLDGSLTLYTANGREHVIDFNGAGAPAIASLVELIRPTPLAVDKTSPYGAALDLSAIDRMLVGQLRELERREPLLRIRAVHGRGTVAHRSGLARLLRRTHVLGALIVATTPTELHIISRRDLVNVLKKPDLSHRHTVITLSGLRSIKSEPHPTYEALVELTVRMQSNSLTIAVPEGSTTARELMAIGRS